MILQYMHRSSSYHHQFWELLPVPVERTRCRCLRPGQNSRIALMMFVEIHFLPVNGHNFRLPFLAGTKAHCANTEILSLSWPELKLMTQLLSLALAAASLVHPHQRNSGSFSHAATPRSRASHPSAGMRTSYSLTHPVCPGRFLQPLVVSSRMLNFSMPKHLASRHVRRH